MRKAKLTLIIVCQLIISKAIEYNSLYSTLFISPKIYLSFLDRVSAVLITVSNIDQKLKTEAQVLTKLKRLFLFKNSSLSASKREIRVFQHVFLLSAFRYELDYYSKEKPNIYLAKSYFWQYFASTLVIYHSSI